MLVFKNNRKIDLNDYCLIIPSVSVGNVGQLAVDLLISTFKLNKIGHIRQRNILPVAALDVETNGITTECELFASTTLKISVIQIRSTYGCFSTISSFFSELCKSVKCVVILTGSYAYERKNIHLVTEPLRFLATDAFFKCELPLIPQNWKKLDSPAHLGDDSRIKIPGSGIGDHLFHLCKQENIPAAVIINYVSEGDNRGDAVNLANFLDSWLTLRKKIGISESSWSFPSEWDMLFGNTYPPELF